MLKIEIPYCSAVSETGSFVFCVYDVSVSKSETRVTIPMLHFLCHV